ncbi:MAG: preprotein translocase subunit SecD, partial [Methanofollis sp.]|nr:preprotein translocase subunit SecD [Methanofollis sp.]
MKEDSVLRKLSRDWRVVLMVALVIFSIFAIGPHFDENGQFATNLQYGLDLQEGSWLQMEFQAEVVTVQTGQPLQEIATNLTEQLDAEVIPVGPDQLEVRTPMTEAELRPLFEQLGAEVVTVNLGVSKDTAESVKRVLDEKVNSLGTKDARVNILTGLNGITRYVRVELAGVDMETANEIVGKQGKFEIRIQTTGNQTQHVLFGDSITSVGTPEKSPQYGTWGVGFTLDEAGAKAFQEAAISSNAVNDPQNHEMIMYLDNETVFDGPLNLNLANSLKVNPVRSLTATT